MITENTLKEWRQDNSSRRFPFADTAGDTLPPSFLVGLDIGIPPEMTKKDAGDNTFRTLKEDYAIYISEVIIGTSMVRISFAVPGIPDGPVAFVEAPTAQIENTPGWTIAALPVEDKTVQGITGTVYFGHPKSFLVNAGTYSLDPVTGGIDVTCIHPYPDSFKGLLINGQLFTGDITLVEGSGIQLDFNVENELVISYTPEDALSGIFNREQLIEALRNYYGAPILTIDGTPPAADGNFVITATDDSCVEITTTDHGITIANTCATPCCDKEVLADIAAAIQTLNERAARLASYLDSASTNLNSLQNELSVLKIGLKQQ